jgi:hypothetical protein
MLPINLSLTQTGTSFQGTAEMYYTINNSFIELGIIGTVLDDSVVITQTEILRISPVRGMPQWCSMTMKLPIVTFNASTSFIGPWQGPGGPSHSGNMYLTRSRPVISVEGDWKGTLLQNTTVFTYELSLAQEGSILQGTLTTRGQTSSTARPVSGEVIGNAVIFKEIGCLSELSFTNRSGVPELRGTRQGIDCHIGLVSVEQQSRHPN